MRSSSPRGTFRADLPPGDYEVELIFAVRGNGTREGEVDMDVSRQGAPASHNSSPQIQIASLAVTPRITGLSSSNFLRRRSYMTRPQKIPRP